jgi:hypothetical protein
MNRARVVSEIRAVPSFEGPCERCGRLTAGWLCGTCNVSRPNAVRPSLVYGAGATAGAEQAASVRIFRKRRSNTWNSYVPGPEAA